MPGFLPITESARAPPRPPSGAYLIGYGRHAVDDADIDAVVAALRSDRITQGPRVEQFESALAQYCGSAHAVAVSSGTAALHLGLLALGLAPSHVEGSTLEPGSAPEVITTPIGFVGASLGGIMGPLAPPWPPW